MYTCKLTDKTKAGFTQAQSTAAAELYGDIAGCIRYRPVSIGVSVYQPAKERRTV